MPKKVKNESQEEIDETEESQEEENGEAKKEAKEKVKEKIKEVKSAAGGKAVNVVGEIEDEPDEDASDSEWKAWAKGVTETLNEIKNHLLGQKSDDDKSEDEEEKNEDADEVKKSKKREPWYDRKIL